MRLPADEAIIPAEKLVTYLLVLRVEDDKSKFLAQAGFTIENPGALEGAIRQLLRDNDAIRDRVNEYGEYFRVVGDLIGVNGRVLRIVTIWIVKAKSDGKYRFVTLNQRRIETMKPELYSRVVVNRDIPAENLRQGDVATLIEYLEHPGGGEEGAILEIFNVLGESIGIATVPVSAIEVLNADYVPAVRLSARPE